MSITIKGMSARLRELEGTMPGMGASGGMEEQWCDAVIDYVMDVLPEPSARRTRLLRIFGSACLDGYKHPDLPPLTPSPPPLPGTYINLPAGTNFEDFFTPDAVIAMRKKNLKNAWSVVRIFLHSFIRS